MMKANAQSFDIHFPGNCEGMHIDIAPSLIVSGYWTGCLSGAVLGNVAIDFIFPPHNLAAGMGVNVGWSLNDPLAGFATINFANMTMCVYFSHGGANCVPVAFGTPPVTLKGTPSLTRP
jgi:hypothetical protein